MPPYAAGLELLHQQQSPSSSRCCCTFRLVFYGSHRGLVVRRPSGWPSCRPEAGRRAPRRLLCASRPSPSLRPGGPSPPRLHLAAFFKFSTSSRSASGLQDLQWRTSSLRLTATTATAEACIWPPGAFREPLRWGSRTGPQLPNTPPGACGASAATSDRCISACVCSQGRAVRRLALRGETGSRASAVVVRMLACSGSLATPDPVHMHTTSPLPH